MPKVVPPVLLSAEHEVAAFDCNAPSLNAWLQKKALINQTAGTSRCFVLCEGKKVIGYYSLSLGAIGHASASKCLAVVLLNRFAIDEKYHNTGLGSALLRDALIRVVSAARAIEVFAIVLPTLSESAKRFYLSRGFVQSPLDPMMLMMTVETARLILTVS